MNTKAPLVLASKSPRRHQLLADAGFEFEIVGRDVEEIIYDDIHPRAVAVMISENKAKAYDDLCGDNIVITADTIVTIKDKVLGKPADLKEATRMLKMLSGKSHHVITGVTLFHKGRFRSFSDETKVTFRDLRDSEIDYYVENYRPLDKAGAYGIQEWIGMVGVDHIEGDFYNVMGLPLGKLYLELMQME
ncbi:Maf family nucleotide pyrophosphatase [Pontibacter sp. G13]|uniref:Maf family nucleotide pyrophosphatase n=1 Tax=Pontibacter sp. G13 TaxID=3074898 RepID=UPI00288A9D19|nr:Maf family nucleotide pyrophosphatase [Pontibacter sp. G13]WNJ21144.1 Maf family nucleotide pyrophosphatase [Pontibacter sp. G13]